MASYFEISGVLTFILFSRTGGNSWSSGPAPPPPPGTRNDIRARSSREGGSHGSLSAGAIAGVVFGVLVLLGIIIFAVSKRRTSPPSSIYLEEERLSQRMPFSPIETRDSSGDLHAESRIDFRGYLYSLAHLSVSIRT